MDWFIIFLLFMCCLFCLYEWGVCRERLSINRRNPTTLEKCQNYFSHGKDFETGYWAPACPDELNHKFQCFTCGLIYETASSDDPRYRELVNGAFQYGK